MLACSRSTTRLSFRAPTEDDRTVTTDAQKKSNRRMAWILVSIAVAIFIGFMVKTALLSS